MVWLTQIRRYATLLQNLRTYYYFFPACLWKNSHPAQSKWCHPAKNGHVFQYRKRQKKMSDLGNVRKWYTGTNKNHEEGEMTVALSKLRLSKVPKNSTVDQSSNGSVADPWSGQKDSDPSHPTQRVYWYPCLHVSTVASILFDKINQCCGAGAGPGGAEISLRSWSWNRSRN